MNNKIKFTLSDTEYMEFVSNNLSIDQVYTCLDLEVYWQNNSKLLIGIESAGDVEIFAQKLLKAINGELKLHSSIKENLGLLWNKKNQLDYNDIDSQKQFVYALSDDGRSRYWVGMRYFLWGTHGDANPYVATWLYNDEHGSIILEVTEMYRWSMQEYDPSEGIPFVTFEKFIKNYKPILKKIIPRQIIEEWAQLAQK